MPSPNQADVLNTLLKALPNDVFGRLSPCMRFVDLPLRHSLVDADKPTTEVCFIERGLGSIVASSSDDEFIEVGHIGREGMSGTHLLLKVDRTPTKTFMQVAGQGIMVPSAKFLAVLEEQPPTRDFFLRYVHCCELQLAHSALANARYSVHERLARWLLMSHDRLDGDDLPLTHEFLAIMLGVRRSGVTDQIHILEGSGAIKATRGKIHIISRPKLEDVAAGSYGVPELEYQRLIGRPIKS